MGRKKETTEPTFGLRIGDNSKADFTKFVTAFEHSNLVNCNFDEIDYVLSNPNYQTVTHPIACACGWVISKTTHFLHDDKGGVDVFFNGLMDVASGKLKLDKDGHDNVKTFIDAVAELAQLIGDDYPKFFTVDTQLDNFRRLAVYLIARATIKHALKFEGTHVVAASSVKTPSTKPDTTSVDINKLNQLIEELTKHVSTEISNILSGLRADSTVIKFDGVRSDVARLVSTLSADEINNSTTTDIITKFGSDINALIFKYIRAPKTVTTTAIVPVTAASSSDINKLLLPAINNLFNNDGFKMLLDLDEKELDVLKKFIVDKLSGKINMSELSQVSDTFNNCNEFEIMKKFKGLDVGIWAAISEVMVNKLDKLSKLVYTEFKKSGIDLGEDFIKSIKPIQKSSDKNDGLTEEQRRIMAKVSAPLKGMHNLSFTTVKR